jgi:hypothetical protein
VTARGAVDVIMWNVSRRACPSLITSATEAMERRQERNTTKNRKLGRVTETGFSR